MQRKKGHILLYIFLLDIFYSMYSYLIPRIFVPYFLADDNSVHHDDPFLAH
jgi:hypothetical protein